MSDMWLWVMLALNAWSALILTLIYFLGWRNDG